jgi:conjugal transfer pilus assembly protein TraU
MGRYIFTQASLARIQITQQRAAQFHPLNKFRELCLIFIFLIPLHGSEAKCIGRFLNPVTDICWKCIFPITIAGIDIVGGNPSPSSPRSPICICNRPPFNQPTPGIPIGFWEPVRLVDVTRTPYCLVNMGGIQVANTGIKFRGDVEENPHDGSHQSFYHVHWYIYPIIYWLEVLMDFVCLENHAIDLAYLTELDPLWNDDEKSFILNPEAILFGNPIAQAACAADCVAASAKLPLNPLFWCNGCQGGLYPFTGTITDHMGGVQASLLITGRFMAKLHRELLGGYLDFDGPPPSNGKPCSIL